LVGLLLGILAGVAKGDAIRKTALVVLFAAYGFLVSMWLVGQIGHLFLSRATELSLTGAPWFYTPFYTLGIVIWALWPPRRARGWAAGIAVVVGVLAFNFVWPLRAHSDRLYVDRRLGALHALVADILDYKRIRQMDHDYIRALNGSGFDYPGSSSAPHFKRVPLEAIFARDSIDPRVFEDFERRLAELHLMGFWADSAGVTFSRDRDTGLLYRLHDDPPLQPGAPLGNAGRIVRVLAKQWYWYSSAG
jgi:hypothetical protein